MRKKVSVPLVLSFLIAVATPFVTYFSTHGMERGLFDWFFWDFIFLPLIIISFLLVVLIRSFQKQWRLAVCAASGIAIVIFGQFTPGAEYRGIDFLRFYLWSRYYEDQVARARRTIGTPTLMSFDWGESGFAGQNYFYALVYDDSDEIAQPRSDRSEEWAARAKIYAPTLLTGSCRTSARAVGMHFYVLNESC